MRLPAILPATGLLALLVLCPCACRKQHKLATTGGVTGQPAVDELLAGLQSEKAEERQFALLYVTHFQLDGYQKELRKLAQKDPVAGVTLAAVYKEPGPALAWYAKQDAAPGLDGLLGGVLGLGCARDLPPAFWQGLLDETAAGQRASLVWDMAQLDVEPGGPLGLSDEVIATAAKLAETASTVPERAAYDALLGGRGGHRIDWQANLDYLSRSSLTPTQWVALLRWTTRETWQRLLTSTKDEQVLCNLLTAAAMRYGGGQLRLPWTREQCQQRGLGPEYTACMFAAGKLGSMSAPLEELLRTQRMPDAGGKQEEPAEKAAQRKERLGETLRLLQYAVQRGDHAAVSKALELGPQLTPDAFGGVLSTIERYTPEEQRRTQPDDEQLQALVDLADPIAAYWLIFGWPDRAPVLESRMAALVRVTPDPENAKLVYAYRLRQAQIVLTRSS
jgi:hypothetical protein